MLPWLYAFLFTQVVECPIYVWALRHRRRPPGEGTTQGEGRQPPIRRDLIVAFAASALTHPVVWFVIPPVCYQLAGPWLSRAPGLVYWSTVVVAEAFAVTAEGLFLSEFELEQPLWWSLGANLASVGLGLVCRQLCGWP